jgi:hypothetical protein
MTRKQLSKKIKSQRWEKLCPFNVRLGKSGMLLSSHIIGLQMRIAYLVHK